MCAAELDALGVLRAFQLPGIAVAQPVIRLLHLVAVLDQLAEHAVLVAQAVALDRQLQGGAAVEETGRQAPQSAVAKPGVRLGLGDLLQEQTQVVESSFRLVADAQVEHGVAQGAAHEELQGQVVGALAVGLVVGVAGLLPAFHEAIAHDDGQGPVRIVG